MQVIDYIVVAVYLGIIIGLGVFFGRNQSRQEFFHAGGSMGWFVVGLSVMATLFSSNSFVFFPSAAFGDSLKLGLCLVSFTLMTPIVMYVFIPIYARLEVETAYEYLERRYHVAVRTLASALFILLRIGWLVSMTYAASLVVAEVSGFSQTTVIVVLGGISVGYTMLGGLRAVMWTDVLQFFVFAGTIIAALLLILSKGNTTVGEVIRTYFEGREGLVVDFRLDMTLPFGTWAVLIGIFLEGLSAFGVDQVAVQRYLAASSERDSKLGAVVNLVGMWIVIPGLLLIGVALYSWFGQNPSELGEGTLQEILVANPKVADAAMPQFVRLHFPPGLAGLFIAALMAAIMSSMDSGIHSITTAVVVDFRDRFLPQWRPESPRRELIAIRILIVILGAVAIFLACHVESLGSVFDVGKKLTSAFGGPLLAIFVLALFSRRSTWQAVFLSGVVSSVVTLWLSLTQSWFSVWYWPIGVGMALAIGWSASHLWPPQPAQLTWHQVMRQKEKP